MDSSWQPLFTNELGSDATAAVKNAHDRHGLRLMVVDNKVGRDDANAYVPAKFRTRRPDLGVNLKQVEEIVKFRGVPLRGDSASFGLRYF